AIVQVFVLLDELDEAVEISGLLLRDDNHLPAQLAAAQLAWQVHDVEHQKLVILNELREVTLKATNGLRRERLGALGQHDGHVEAVIECPGDDAYETTGLAGLDLTEEHARLVAGGRGVLQLLDDVLNAVRKSLIVVPKALEARVEGRGFVERTQLAVVALEPSANLSTPKHWPGRQFLERLWKIGRAHPPVRNRLRADARHCRN